MEVLSQAEKKSYLGEILRSMETLAGGRVNDAVKLAYLDGDGVDKIDGLDLTALAEFKRGSNGVVELKFINRMAILEELVGLLGGGGGGGGAEEFFQAWEGKAETG